MENPVKKCTSIALVGDPNVGKSSLLNKLVGQKISITTHKVQTTRVNVKGITNVGNSQLIFIDTPGIFEPKRKLERSIVTEAMSGLEAAEKICVIFDVHKLESDAFEQIKDKLAEKGKENCFAIINKIDLIKNRDDLLPKLKQIYDSDFFAEVFPMSAVKEKGIDNFLNVMAEKAEISDWLYDEDTVTDVSVRTIAEEITREKAFILLHKELPYSLKVETEQWEEDEDGVVNIHQAIFVAKDSHKNIVIGEKASKIKEIGIRARKSITLLLEQKVRLFLFVKVREDWIDRDYK